MVVDSLPDRPITFNENEHLAAQAREAIPHENPAVPNNEPAIHAFILISDKKTYALYYDDEWECVYQTDTPDDAFTGAYFTNEDFDHPEINAAMDALEEQDSNA